MTIRSLLLTLTLLILPLSPATGQDWQAVSEASERGDYATVMELLRPFAEQGGAPAQTALGLMYYEGEGVPQDYAEAIRWCRKAAEQGYAEAQYCLGIMHAKGEGVPQDHAEAARWYRKAAEQGHASAPGIKGKTNVRVLIETDDYTTILKAMCDVDRETAHLAMATVLTNHLTDIKKERDEVVQREREESSQKISRLFPPPAEHA